MPKKLLRSFVLAVCMFAVSGCGIIDLIYLPPAEDTAQEIFEAANDAMSEKNYVRAVELYNKLRDNYPFSPYTVDAELSLATPTIWTRSMRSRQKRTRISNRCTPGMRPYPMCSTRRACPS